MNISLSYLLSLIISHKPKSCIFQIWIFYFSHGLSNNSNLHINGCGCYVYLMQQWHCCESWQLDPGILTAMCVAAFNGSLWIVIRYRNLHWRLRIRRWQKSAVCRACIRRTL